MIKFHIEGNESQIDVDVKKAIHRVTKAVNRHQNIKGKHCISFILVNNEEIQKINASYRKIDAPTDVITFAMIDGEEQGVLPEELGDIFISCDKVKSQAKEYQHSEIREFSFLVIHGLLHSLGYDHQTPEDEAEMFKIQDEILDKLKIHR